MSPDEGPQPIPRGSDRTRWILLAILALALLLRAIHFLQIAPAPFTHFPVVDARMFQQMAEAFASGDLVGDTAYQKGPLYPHLVAVVYAVAGPNIPLVLATGRSCSSKASSSPPGSPRCSRPCSCCRCGKRCIVPMPERGSRPGSSSWRRSRRGRRSTRRAARTRCSVGPARSRRINCVELAAR